MRIWAISLALSLSLCAIDAQAAKSADVMPPPQKAPRVPVDREALKEPREFEGKAKAIDGERILVGEKEIRLFGIVTPGISSNYGPQARQKLDQIIKDGAVLCKVTDRDREGRPIAFCGTVDTPDLSYEMLRQGWAMADRKALKNNSLASIYEKVEQEAQAQNKGLFAPMPLVASVPVSNPANTVTVPLAPPPAKAEDQPQPQSAPAPAPVAVPAPVATITLGGPQPIITPASRTEPQKDDKSAKTAEPAKVSAPAADQNFIERYQGVLAGLLWLIGTMGFGSMLIIRDRMRLREKRVALAAALHGELTSARHICRAKARELTRQRRLRDEDAPQPRPALLWPRLRTFVYQAHVGSIGLLGSELARRVASIYGQCAEYAAYYQALQRMPSIAAVSETLNTLADHMDSVLDGLLQVEASGRTYVPEPVDEVQVPQDTAEDRTETPAERNAADEEAKVIRARFERMAQSMVGMLGRKKEIQYTGAVEETPPAPKAASDAAE